MSFIRNHGTRYWQFFTIAPFARQRNMVLVVDKILTVSQQQPDFYMSRKSIVQQHFGTSPYLTKASTHLARDSDFVRSLIEDAVELAGEVDDWRLVRIWILMIEWILEKTTETRTMEIDSPILVETEESYSHSGFKELLVSASLLFEQGTAGTGIGTDLPTEVFSKMTRQFLRAQSDYIFCSGGRPGQLALRKRLVFLLGNAVLQNGNLLVWTIRDCFREMKRSSEEDNSLTVDQTTAITTTTTIVKRDRPPQSAAAVAVATLFLCGMTVEVESEEALADTIEQQLNRLLRELQIFCDLIKEDSTIRGSQLQDLFGQILGRYLTILRLNSTMVADIVCAMGVYIGTDDSNLWQTLIRTALAIMDMVFPVPTTTLSSSPWMMRLRDIAEVLDSLALDFALGSTMHI
ncbi:hypothetical protein BGX28_003342 [Mortierella sp. GBA30]|nr:hypothetical protein BGX28_003342 [Mortierella sp. GBA30]